jgi:malate dehydrogenase
MKISVIGAAGSVGAPAVFYLAASGLANEIVMIGGRRQNVLEQHAMDIATAVSEKGVVIRKGTYEDMVGSEIVINAAGVPQGLIADRMEMLPKNIPLIRDIALMIKKYSPEAVVITATNPVDPLNYATFLAGGFNREKLIGYSVNDTFRFKEMLSVAYGVPASMMDAMVIGEHGATQVHLFSTVQINGEKVGVDEEVKSKVRNGIPKVFKRLEELKAGRTAGWTCAVGLEKIVRAVAEDTGAVIPCSVVLEGEYGQEGISMSVPVQLGKDGVSKIFEYDLAPDEKEGLSTTVATLKKAAEIVRKNI